MVGHHPSMSTPCVPVVRPSASILHTVSDKNWTVERPGNEAIASPRHVWITYPLYVDLSNDSRPRCSKDSVKTAACSVDSMLINIKFVIYNGRAPPLHVYPFCTCSQTFRLHFCILNRWTSLYIKRICDPYVVWALCTCCQTFCLCFAYCKR